MRWLLVCLAACGGGVATSPMDASAPMMVDGGAPKNDAGAACFAPAPNGPLEIGVEQGTIRGIAASETTRFFGGIPFAAPPVGPKRFLPPDPPSCLKGVLDTKSFGEMCTQVNDSGDVVGSEDCLTLNVWTPMNAWAPSKPAGTRAVMVWIHGGDNIIGSAQDYFADVPVYDGQALAEREDVIVVTIQYRLGAFGFLSHPALADSRGFTGNFGTLDQIAALGWVQRNIAAFGGDPSRVTIFGQSAGGDAVCALLASPLAAGLFSRAILHSGACYASSDAVTKASAHAVLAMLGCSSNIGACLRSKTKEEIARAPGGALNDQATADHYISVDGKVLPMAPRDMFAAGKGNDVPAIFMVTKDEYLSLVDLVVPQPLKSQSDFDAYVKASFDSKSAQFIIEHYPLASFPSPSHAFVEALSDTMYHCRVRGNLRALLQGRPNAKAYRAIFAQAYSDPRLVKYGAGHGTDVPYVFDTFGSIAQSTGERALSKQMMETWVRFAKTGDPNGNGLPSWPIWNAGDDDYMRFDEASSMSSRWHEAICDEWDKL